MSTWNKKDYQKAFAKIKQLLQRYYEHEYEYTSEPEDVATPESIDVTSTSNAFDILLVLTGNRDAMLFQSTEDQTEDQKGGDELRDVLMRLAVDFQVLIKDNLHITNIEVITDASGDMWIYNTRIQEEVDEKFGTSEMTDILGYLSPYSDKFDGSVTFKYNGNLFLIFGVNNLTTAKIKELRHRLKVYQSVAKQLDGEVTLTIDFK